MLDDLSLLRDRGFEHVLKMNNDLFKFEHYLEHCVPSECVKSTLAGQDGQTRT